jgi:nucleotide-binding universal stress UspA family protein
MYKQILLAYDGSETGRRALREFADLAELLKAQVHLLAVVPTFAGLMMAEGVIIEDNYDKERQRFQDVLDEGLAKLHARGLVADGRVAHGDPVDEICARARELKADLICVGHRHANTWAQRWWRGSLGKTLTDHAPCSVLIAMTP